MDYFALVKKAFQITIKNKYLWLFGFFIGTSSGSYNFYSGGGGSENNSLGDYSYQQFVNDARSFLADNWTWIAVISLVVLGVMIFFLVMRILSQGALIGSVNKIDNDKNSNIKDGFKMGLKNFWRVLGLGFVSGITIFLSMIVLGVPIALLFIYKMYVRGVILALIGLVIFIPLSIVVNYMAVYGYRYIVLKNKKAIESLKLAFNLFIKNIWPSVVTSLILMLVGMITVIATIILVIALGIPFLILGILAYLAAKWVGAMIVIGLAIVVFFVLMVLLGAAISTFQSSLWTLTFKELIKE